MHPQSELIGNTADPADLLHRPDRSATAVVRVLDGNQSRDGTVRVDRSNRFTHRRAVEEPAFAFQEMIGTARQRGGRASFI
jgi:hypothetical protein